MTRQQLSGEPFSAGAFWVKACPRSLQRAAVARPLTFSLIVSVTVLDSMRHETAQARMWNRMYMTRVLEEDLTGGQKAQHREQGVGPQQQHIC